MRRPRLYVPNPLADTPNLTLTGDRAHYLGRVLRLKAGDECLLFDGYGLDYPATVATAGRGTMTLRLGPPQAVATESPLFSHLMLAVTRGSRMDVALQKAVELGASALTPVFTERCGVNLEARQVPRRLEHWQGIVRGAAEQCGRARIPRLAPPVNLQEGLERLPPAPATRLVLDPAGGGALADIAPPADGVVILVGPEGGLTDGELAAAVRHGFRGITLGPRVLRAETAPLAVLAALQSLWGDFRPSPGP
ncbi:MAG: 16S rRNA (uracil(1498)-N(3))-methyltransferase [Gammaproteobacteria bacterium]|nr:16S rRNA (uracil(1498)-N(3))-methyltransferase [Gammaproteobacteria bacterium]